MEKVKNKKREKYHGSKGYRLHLARFKFSSKQGIRTIKYPLGDWDSTSKQVLLGDKEEEFAKKIKSDYENLYGALNITTYGEKGSKLYSLKDFWVDSLRAGVILTHTNSKLRDAVKKIDGSGEKIDKKQQELMRDKNRKWFELVDFEKFKKEFILSGSKRMTATTTLNSVTNKFIGCLKAKAKEDKKAQSLSEEYGSELFKLIRDKKDQDEFLSETFGVKKSLYEAKPTSKEEDFGELIESTFYILPDLEFAESMDILDCLERVEKVIADNGLGTGKKVEELIGVSDDAGGFSNYFNKILDLLRNERFEVLEEYILGLSGLWKGKERELRKRLVFLSQKAKQLGEPQLVDGWHQYRSDIGGKIQSWISNTLRQDEEIKKQLFGYSKEEKGGKEKFVKGHRQELESIIEEIGEWESNNDEKMPEEFKKEKAEVAELMNQIENQLGHLEKYKKEEKRIPIDELQSYRDLLSDYRTKFNFFFQDVHGHLDEEEENKKKKIPNVRKEYPALFKELKTPPSFVGDVKMAENGTYEKYFESLKRLQAGIEFLRSVDDKEFDKVEIGNKETVEKVRHSLESVVRMYRNAQSPVGEQVAATALKIFGFNVADFKEDKIYNHVWRNKNARERRGKNLGNDVEGETYIKELDKLIETLKPDWDKHKKLDVDKWLDLVALAKIRYGLLTHFYDISAVEFTKGVEKEYPRIKTMETRFKEKKSKDVNTMLQTAVLPEMKGTLSKMSTEKLIARYVVQPMDSEDGFPLISNLWKDGKREAEGQGEGYFISPETKGTIRRGGKKKEKNACMLKEKKVHAESIEEVFVEKDKLFKIQSSPAQIQFLQNSFSGAWKDFSPEMSSHSFIFEEFISIKWDDEGPRISPEIDKKTGKDKKKLFVSIPFKLGFEKSEKRNDELDERDRLLGVDIGEYGVATYLLDAKDMKKSRHSSFVYEPALRKIREGIQENKDRQKAGTFSIPNTKVGRLRDNAITILRNRIHDVVVSNEARPIYEREVSAFESGSGKISKIYDSLKRSDVYQETKVEESVADLVWGAKSKHIGRNVSAYATSYMCSHCHKSIYAHISKEDYGKEYKVLDVKSEKSQSGTDKKEKYQSIITFGIDGERVKGYMETDAPRKKDSWLDGKTVQGAVKDYTRPPLKVFFTRHNGEKVFKKLGIDRERFELTRGSQAVYICPFCDHIADADVQAAMWIALKGWLNLHIKSKDQGDKRAIFKDKDIQKKWGNDKIDIKCKLKFLMDYAKDKKIPPVELKNLNVR